MKHLATILLHKRFFARGEYKIRKRSKDQSVTDKELEPCVELLTIKSGRILWPTAISAVLHIFLNWAAVLLLVLLASSWYCHDLDPDALASCKSRRKQILTTAIVATAAYMIFYVADFHYNKRRLERAAIAALDMVDELNPFALPGRKWMCTLERVKYVQKLFGLFPIMWRDVYPSLVLFEAEPEDFDAIGHCTGCLCEPSAEKPARTIIAPMAKAKNSWQ
ncbi:hypothetical protein HDU88_007970 [Geranomyces variabilis]|nr:hypothetical protein HDU88_007970 [Geranomyces variabilis]